ncbi:unnamed protein product [Oikopleura dioica]|uniref:Uncharacterized protein n=1 Tax=Oikopleura dioica TaxID=34765 RepID=E4XB38_OIKDI|nr:unnamed protein product [Oikopleura dioica]
MKARIDEANKPKTKNAALEQSKIELERLKEQKKKILEQHKEVERNCQAVQAKDPEYKAIVQKANDEYTQMYQQVAYKEQELARMREAYQQQLAYQDRTEELQQRKLGLEKLQRDFADAKRKRDKTAKEADKLRKEIEKVMNEREKMQQQIDVYKNNQLKFQSEEDALNSEIAYIQENTNVLQLALEKLAEGASDEEKNEIVDELFDVDRAAFEVETAQNAVNKAQQDIEAQEALLKEKENQLETRKVQNKKYLDEIKSYEKQKKSLNMKIGVIQDFFAKKDVKVRQELAKEKELRSAIESEYATIKDRQTFLNNELEAYKKTRANLLKRHEIASRERTQSINKVEREAHETWLKWRETDRKGKDLERETKSLQDQLARKAELKTGLEREIHEIHVRQERKAAKRHQEIMEMRARQERDRMLHRMRGPEGDEARRTGRVQNGPRSRGPAPLVQRPALSHAQRQQQLLYHDSPQLSPIHGNASLQQPRPSLQPKQIAPPQFAPQMPMAPQMQGHPHFPQPSGYPPNSYPQYIAPQPPVMTQNSNAPPAQSSPRQENGHSQHNERNYMA